VTSNEKFEIKRDVCYRYSWRFPVQNTQVQEYLQLSIIRFFEIYSYIFFVRTNSKALLFITNTAKQNFSWPIFCFSKSRYRNWLQRKYVVSRSKPKVCSSTLQTANPTSDHLVLEKTWINKKKFSWFPTSQLSHSTNINSYYIEHNITNGRNQKYRQMFRHECRKLENVFRNR